jgi:glyoxylase-like metal-dependent hydrolase (beta-lactamase superfamily II)
LSATRHCPNGIAAKPLRYWTGLAKSIIVATMKNIAISLLAFFLMIGSAGAQSFELKVYTAKSASGLDANSTMISGQRDMIVIDPQFSLAEAHRLVADILESKKNLTTIYITHGHPDHYFGTVALKSAFPAAKIVALPETAAAIKSGWEASQKTWSAQLGATVPGPEPVVPEALTTPYLTLENERFPITAGLRGDAAGNSIVYIPQLKAVIAGDTVFDQTYMPIATGAAREEWMRTLDQIAALQPTIVIPGHEGRGARHDLSAIAFMKKYLADWDVNLAASKTAAEMKERVLKQYPGLGLELRLDGRIAPSFANPR